MSEEVPAAPPSAGGSVGKGILWAIIALVIAAMGSVVAMGIPLLFIGVVQLAWVIPMVIHFRKKGAPQTANGILIFAGLTFLLNATCWGVVAGGLSGASFH